MGVVSWHNIESFSQCCFPLNHSILKAEGCFEPAAVVTVVVGACFKLVVLVEPAVAEMASAIDTNFELAVQVL